MQAMESVPGQVHLFRPRRYFKRLKNAPALPEILGADPTCLAAEVDFF
jgi:hypothetical protein